MRREARGEGQHDCGLSVRPPLTRAYAGQPLEPSFSWSGVSENPRSTAARRAGKAFRGARRGFARRVGGAFRSDGGALPDGPACRFSPLPRGPPAARPSFSSRRPPALRSRPGGRGSSAPTSATSARQRAGSTEDGEAPPKEPQRSGPAPAWRFCVEAPCPPRHCL